jgi:hypothetical protein
MLAEIIIAGLATVSAGGRSIEVTHVRITDAGRRALVGRAK